MSDQISTTDREFVGLVSPAMGRAGAGGHPCQGIYYTPAGGRPTTALIATHYNVDFSEHYLGPYLAERGYGFLGWNTRYRGAEAYFILDHALVDIAVGVDWLRRQGVERIVLLGNSGGGSLMAAYHSQSREPNVGPGWGMRPAPGVESLPAADLYISLAAHPGRPEILTDWMDPSVIDETDPFSCDQDLNLFSGNPDADAGPPFSEEFVARYRAGQRARNDRITDWCLNRLEEVTAAGLPDQVFIMRRTWADPRFVDPSLDPSNRPTPLCYRGDPKTANKGVVGIGSLSTLRAWLNMWSLKESPCRGAAHLARIDVPTLVIQADADCGVFPSQAEEIFTSIGGGIDSPTRPPTELHTLPGDHYFAEDPAYRPAVADLITDWLTRHP